MKNTILIQQDNESTGSISFNRLKLLCSLGKNGITKNKMEGDGATPSGIYPLRKILYRNDRVHLSRVALETNPINKYDGWCDQPNDINYNSKITLPYSSSAESLWRNDCRYDIIIVIGYNDKPIIHGKGSAIFIHITDNYLKPTDGCIAVKLEDMLSIIKECNFKTICKISNE